MNAHTHYLFQEFPPGKLSEIYYTQSVLAIASKNFSQEGARYIYIQYIYWVPIADAGGVITFFDQFNQPLFSTQNSLTLPNWAPIFQVKKGPQLKISCSQQISFAVSYQYIISDDVVNLKEPHRK